MINVVSGTQVWRTLAAISSSLSSLFLLSDQREAQGYTALLSPAGTLDTRSKCLISSEVCPWACPHMTGLCSLGVC